MISHGILPILPPNCAKFAHFFATTEKIKHPRRKSAFPPFCAKCRKYKIKKRDGHVKLRNGQGEVMVKNILLSPLEP